MKKIIMLTFIILLLTISIVSASSSREFRIDSQMNELCEFAKERFQVGLEIPGFLPYGNEVMNIYDTNYDIIGYMQTEENILVRMECGSEHPNPTYKIYIKDLQTIKDIMRAESQINELNNKKSQGEIRIEGVTFDKQVTSFFTGIALSIGGWFI